MSSKRSGDPLGCGTAIFLLFVAWLFGFQAMVFCIIALFVLMILSA